jgi:hypothetical protein
MLSASATTILAITANGPQNFCKQRTGHTEA